MKGEKDKNERNFIKPFFLKGKKGMETWFVVILILALILLVLVIILWGSLGSEIKGLLGKLGDLL